MTYETTGMGLEAFDDFVERKPRCKAVMLHPGNVWDVAKGLRNLGLGTQINARLSETFTLEVLRGDQSLFTADVGDGDVIILTGTDNVSCTPAREFRKTWERYTNA